MTAVRDIVDHIRNDERERCAAYLERQADKWEHAECGFEHYNRVRVKLLRIEARVIREGHLEKGE